MRSVPDGWGGWRFCERTLALVYRCGRVEYTVPLRACRTAAQVLDWLAQVRKKRWATDACLAGLLRALDDVLRLQEAICGYGLPRPPLTDADIRALGDSYVASR